MKRFTLTVVLGVIISFAAVTFTQAQVLVSVNFQGGNTVGLAASDIAGASPFDGVNWNNALGASGGPIILNDATGAASALTLTSYAAGPFGVDGPSTDNSTPQKILFGGALDVNFGNATFTIDGLSAFSSYDLVVYYDGGTSFPAARHADIIASGSALTYYVAGIDSVYDSYTQSNSTDSGTFASGNYVVFSGLIAGSETVTMEYGNNSMGLVGFQVLGTQAVPEPSTWALMTGGLGLLVGFQQLRRRRA